MDTKSNEVDRKPPECQHYACVKPPFAVGLFPAFAGGKPPFPSFVAHCVAPFGQLRQRTRAPRFSRSLQMKHQPLVVSSMAHDLVGSEILQIATEVRRMKKDGFEVVDYTVGDFNPDYFSPPADLVQGIAQALLQGHTNYPPAMGIDELRRAVAEFYRTRLGLDYSSGEILIGAGARPMIYTTCATLLDPADVVLYGVPSWNNNHDAHIVGARPIEVRTTAAQRFFPSVEDIRPHIGELNLIALNSPLNPTGTLFTREQLLPICELVAEENRSRARRGAKPCYILYDQVYWLNRFGPEHVHPVGLVPELKSATIYIDGISKYLAATGLRVGWLAGPEAVVSRMSAVLGHLGAWAPKAEQVATAQFLGRTAAFDAFVEQLNANALSRLQRLHQGMQALKGQGLAVDSIQPQGGIYLSVSFDYVGARTSQGKQLTTLTDLRQFLLEDARVAMVPFTGFGVKEPTSWFRCSVGAVSPQEVELSLQRLAASLRSLSR